MREAGREKEKKTPNVVVLLPLKGAHISWSAGGANLAGLNE